MLEAFHDRSLIAVKNATELFQQMLNFQTFDVTRALLETCRLAESLILRLNVFSFVLP